MTLTNSPSAAASTGLIDLRSSGPAGPPQAGPPAHLDTIARRIEAHLDAILGAERRRWQEVDEDLAAPLTTLHRFVCQGGKRLRPAFVHWGFVAAGGDPDDTHDYRRVDDAGAAFELLHAFALLHDDVMDGSDTRRGVATTHIDYSKRHTGGQWRGETRRFGESVAILLGDLAHVYADRVMAAQPADALTIWRELQTELMMGQYLDVLGTARGDRSATKARLIVRLKSGRYTIEQPLQLGAALAPAGAHTDRIRATLAAYGAPLGEAFQLRDDVLGAFGVATTIGKPVGDDLREGKPTLLLARAVEHATTPQREVLHRVGSPDLTDDDIAELQDILVNTGALTLIEDTINHLTQAAIHAVDEGDLPDEAAVALTDLAGFIATREH